MLRYVVLLALLLPFPVRALDVLPKDAKYDPSVLHPHKHLGFAIGDRHLHHHQLVGYFQALAGTSKRVKVHEYARSHGDRPLLYVTITSPENHAKLDAIRQEHRKLADPKLSAGVAIDNLPAVIVMGYGVHGNEPSASNVAPLVAYHLAAGTGERHERLLKETVVLLDPCLNPDGFERFAQWANSSRGKVANADPEHREHREAWPSGRTNYYWFDLNRDWLPVQHPESRGRLRTFHQWKPNLVLDFHEMGSGQTFFFQPGVPKRAHPLIPQGNHQLTQALGKHHARALDRIGSLYFTEELFDDFYPGKGSTYPDLHGGVGILFEQASSRGQVQDTVHGKLTFPFTIRNQFQTSLSSLDGLLEMRLKFLEYKRSFYRDVVEEARKHKVKAHVIAAPHDPARLRDFLALLHRHEIQAYRLTSDLKVDGKTFAANQAYVIPTDQPETRFLQVLFETRKSFDDKVFYDISTWTLPLAYNLRHATLESAADKVVGEAFQPGPAAAHAVTFAKDDLAYALDWRHSHSAKALYRLLAADVKTRVASAPFTTTVGKDVRTFGYGTIVVPLGIQPEKREAVVATLREAAKEGVPVYPLATGLSLDGPKLGSGALLPVPNPKILLVTGEGVTAYDAGEVWHLLDVHLGMPVTMVETHRLGTVDLRAYSVVVLVSGTYAGVSAAAADRLKQYVEGGGTIVACGTAMSWLNTRKIVNVPLREGGRGAGSRGRVAYADVEENAALQLISGAIFQTTVDHTHPVCYGLAAGEPLPVFRTNRLILDPTASPTNTPVAYDKEPHLSGYVSESNLEQLRQSGSVVVVGAGSGRAILFADNPVFRGFWRGTSRLFVNALYFGPLTRTGPGRMR